MVTLTTHERRLPVGAEPLAAGGTHFRVWAPASQTVDVVLVEPGRRKTDEAFHELSATPLRSTHAGYFEGMVDAARAGSRYWLRLDTGRLYADPASRFQPDGPYGPSEVIDPEYGWRDAQWPGVTEARPIIYEMHIGTFTREGTYDAARRELPHLAELGISTLEILPLSDFPGRFGWGYDGVLPFAPPHMYGRPDDLRRLIDDAHHLGIGVFIDVVYNHFGPDGCYLRDFSPDYFALTPTDWGDACNFDGPNSGPVREYMRANAVYWITEFHADGLRLDATQAITDRSTPNIIARIAEDARTAGGRRQIWVIGENEPQKSQLMRPSAGLGGLDALWNDDFHHSAMVAMTGDRDAYYTDYLGAPQEFVSAARWGFLYQGQWYSWQKQPRGTPARGLPASAFIAFIQNHDQVANSLLGHRIHDKTSPGKLRAMTALLLLGPWTPMLFQGQEFAAPSPFLYFADHTGDLATAVREGRRTFLSQFKSISAEDTRTRMPDPADERTFLMSKIDSAERASHATALALHKSLIQLRRRDKAFEDDPHPNVDGAVLGPSAFVLRFGGAESPAADRLLLVNLGPALHLPIIPEPLLSPYPSRGWRVLWSSDDAAYGGPGVGAETMMDRWDLPAECAIVLAPDGVVS